MTENCPLCLQRLPQGDAVIVTVEPPAVRVGMRAEKLPPLHAAMLECLALRMGRVVSHGDIAAYLWAPRNEPANPMVTIYPMVRDLRKPLARLGLEIVTAHTQGYMLRRPS